MEVFEFLLAFIQKIKIMLTKNISKWYISDDQHTILIYVPLWSCILIAKMQIQNSSVNKITNINHDNVSLK